MFTCLPAGSLSVGNTPAPTALQPLTYCTQQHWLQGIKELKTLTFKMLSWVPPFTGNTDPQAKVHTGIQLYLFSITKWENVVRCRKGGWPCLSQWKHVGQEHISHFSVFQHRLQRKRNSLLARSTITQCLPYLQIAHLHILTFGSTQYEPDSLPTTIIGREGRFVRLSEQLED